MKKMLIWGLCAAFLLMLPADGFAASISYARKVCKKELSKHPPQIEIRYNYGELKINHEHTDEELAEMMSKLYPLKVNHTINGMTSLAPYAVVESDIVSTGVSGYVCYYPQKVSVITGYEPTVYLRRDLTPDSCRYNVTLRHEQTHLDIGYLSMNRFVAGLKEVLPSVIKNVGVIVKSASRSRAGEDDTLAELNNQYREKVGVLFNSFVQDMIKQQMRIDSTESYEYEGSLCSDGF